jgi:DNA polymerase (family 10)
MKNAEIAAIMYEIADLLEIKDVKFKPVAYRRAAHIIESLTEDLAEIDRRGELEKIPGVGTHIAAKIHELLETGKLAYLDRIKSEIPPGVLDLAELEGIGPKKAMILNRKLGVTSMETLEAAATAGKIRELAGFGEKSEQNILLGIKAKKSTKGRFLLGDILPVAEKILDALASNHSTRKISLAGSIRRRKETIGDVDIIASSPEPERLMAAFTTLKEVDRILGKGPTKSSVVLASGAQVDLRVVAEDQYWTALQYFTGSKDHNIALRRRALEHDWSLSEYGVRDLNSGNYLPVSGEEEIYRMLGLPYIEPELRENRGEIEAAENGTLPVVVRQDAIFGDLHVHTTWSDGDDTLPDMVEAAQKLGYRYIAVCDHARSPEINRGMTVEKVAEQRHEIEKLNRELDGFVVLAGIECNIAVDGSLDLPDRVLKDFDVVIASLHSNLKMHGDEMTKRVLTAMHNDHVDILGHPTGRILLQREPAAVDLNEVFRAAKNLGIILEINGFPTRLEHGVRFAISSDAHGIAELGGMTFGVATARRGWVEAKDVVNTLEAGKLREMLGS